MKVYIGAALAVVVLVAGAWRVQVHGDRNMRRKLARQRIEDRVSMRTIAMLAVVDGKLPMKDGLFDPYELVRKRGAIVGLFRSARHGFGPTPEEVTAGDYAKFPWERCKGPRKLGGAPFPLLWEKEPDLDGRMLAVRSDGMVAVWDPDTLFRAVAEGPVER